MDYRTFTNNLANYSENQKRLVRAKTDLENILYDMANVRGISYDQVIVNGNPSQKALNWLKLDDRYNEKENEVRYYEAAILSVEQAKKKIPKRLWLMLVDKFVKGMTYSAVGIKYGYSDHGIWAMMRRECERYL